MGQQVQDSRMSCLRRHLRVRRQKHGVWCVRAGPPPNTILVLLLTDLRPRCLIPGYVRLGTHTSSVEVYELCTRRVCVIQREQSMSTCLHVAPAAD